MGCVVAGLYGGMKNAYNQGGIEKMGDRMAWFRKRFRVEREFSPCCKRKEEKNSHMEFLATLSFY